MPSEKHPFHESVVQMIGRVSRYSIDSLEFQVLVGEVSTLLSETVIPNGHEKIIEALDSLLALPSIRTLEALCIGDATGAVIAEKERVEREKANAQADEGLDRGTDGMTAPERSAILGLYGVPHLP